MKINYPQSSLCWGLLTPHVCTIHATHTSSCMYTHECTSTHKHTRTHMYLTNIFSSVHTSSVAKRLEAFPCSAKLQAVLCINSLLANTYTVFCDDSILLFYLSCFFSFWPREEMGHLLILSTCTFLYLTLWCPAEGNVVTFWHTVYVFCL